MRGLAQLLTVGLVAAGVVAAAGVLSAAPAMAHATLLRSRPANNAIVAVSPKELVLWFDEAVSPELTSALVYDAHGRPVRLGASHSSEERMFVQGLPTISDGVYSVEWQAVSPADGHVSRGTIVFRVGAGAVPYRAMSSAGTASPVEAFLRWVSLALLVVLIGSMAVALLVLPARREGTSAAKPGALGPHSSASVRSVILSMIRRHARRRVLRLAPYCCAALLGVGVALVFQQALALRSTLPPGTSVTRSAWSLLDQTRWGELWLAQQILLLALIRPLVELARADDADSRPRTRRAAVFSIALIVALAGFHAMASHVGALAPHRGVTIGVEAVHLLAAGGWIGGLLAMTVGLLPVLRRSPADFAMLIRAAWRPFSALAVCCVGLVVGTGLYLAGNQVASPDAAITTLYGRTLLAKVGLVLLVALLGLCNALTVHPAVARPLARAARKPIGWTPVPIRRLPLFIAAEAGLSILVLAASGLLGSSPPARAPAYAAPAPPPPVTLTRTVDDVLVALAVQPNRPGPNVFSVSVTSTRRPALAPTDEVVLRLTPPGAFSPVVTVPLEEVAPGEFRAGGDAVDRPGSWGVDIQIDRVGSADRLAEVDWTVSPAIDADPTILSDRPLSPLLNRLALAIVGTTALLAGLMVVRHRRPRTPRPVSKAGNPIRVDQVSERAG